MACGKGKSHRLSLWGSSETPTLQKDGLLDHSDIANIAVEERQLEKRKLKHGDIILEKSGGGPKQPVGRVALFEANGETFSLSNFTAALRILEPQTLDYSYLHKFLYWQYLSGVTAEMQSHSTGIRNLDTDAYKAIRVPLPPLREQRRIVAVLDKALAAIATAKANTKESLLNLQALFDSRLVGFFTTVGQGWRKMTLGDVCETTQGVQIPKSEQSPTEKPFHRRYLYISDFEHDKNPKYVEDIYPTKLVTTTDIVVANTGSAGKIYRGKNGVLSNNLFKVTCFRQKIIPDFLFYFVTSSLFREYQ